MSRTYVSIDIETTGIAEESYILQIAAVADDLKSPISNLKTLDMPIKYNKITYAEPYALGMNATLLANMMQKDFKTFEPERALDCLVCFLEEVQTSIGLDKRGNKSKVILAGKNVASFDIPKLRTMIAKYSPELMSRFDSVVHYKTLDVGSLYFDIFKYNPSLSEINKLTGRNQVSHNALDDALDVVYAVRYKLGGRNE